MKGDFFIFNMKEIFIFSFRLTELKAIRQQINTLSGIGSEKQRYEFPHTNQINL
jgi:hypothetical protein